MPTQINLCVPLDQQGRANIEKEKKNREERGREETKKRLQLATQSLIEWQQIVVCCRGPPTRHVTLMNFGRSMEQAVSIGKFSRSCSSFSSSSIWQIYWASFAADRLLMVPSLGSDLSNHSPGWSNLWPPTDLLDHKPGPK